MDSALYGQVHEVKGSQKLLAAASLQERNTFLEAAAEALEREKDKIFAANQEDIKRAEEANLAKPLLKRLLFDEGKLQAVLEGMHQVQGLPDPNNRVLEARELDEGLVLQRVSCPIGVIGMIFESRPDALVQIASLCMKSGNAAVLKGGSEAARTNEILARILRGTAAALNLPHIPENWLYLLETREQVREMLTLDSCIDLLIPRGSNEFVKYVMDNTSIPVLGHAEGICHSYIDAEADIDKAVRITVDAKCQYPAVCNALETLLVSRRIAPDFLPPFAEAMERAGVELRGDEQTRRIITCREAAEEDWRTEYLDLILSVKIVDSLEEAISHIHTYGSGHTDSIITENRAAAEQFLQMVDSADVMWNCSTRFSDGFRYGLGAEVGISTLKIHARGPVGLEGLMSYKWKLSGNGHIVADYTGAGARSFTFRDLG
jgi:glutamate-5-semialdehyde dehydrogenase